MVKIRLARGGAKKRPFYHVVVADVRNRRDGRNIERVGFFNPVAKGLEVRLSLNLERIEYWKSKGAILTDRVAALVRNESDKIGAPADPAKAEAIAAAKQAQAAAAEAKAAAKKAAADKAAADKAEGKKAAAAKKAEAKKPGDSKPAAKKADSPESGAVAEPAAGDEAKAAE